MKTKELKFTHNQSLVSKIMKSLFFSKKKREIKGSIFFEYSDFSYEERNKFYEWVIEAPVKFWEARLYALSKDNPNEFYEQFIKGL